MENDIPQTGRVVWAPAPTDYRLRLWPGVVIVLLYWAVLKVPSQLMPGTMEQFMVMFFGSMIVPALFVLWWLLLSRVRWTDRFLGLVACAAVGAGVWLLYHPTMQGKGVDGAMMALTFNVLPVVMTGWVVWLLVARSLSRQVRMVGLCIVFLLTWGFFTALRFDGVTGSFSPEFSYRWTPKAEDRNLAMRSAYQASAETVAAAAGQSMELTPADWPGFRGPARDGRRTGVRIGTQWKKDNPPKELWRRPIGPGWGSFAVVGLRVYTQEQLGDLEAVVCLDAGTGKEIWAHTDKTRHEDNESSAGPRATPTFHDGRIYSLGGTGMLNCLDAVTGKVIWAHDIAKDSGAKQLHWGYSGSPLVEQGIVTVFAGGPDKGVLGYRADTGELAWAKGTCTGSYCSTQPARVAGVEQLVLTTAQGLSAYDPVKGDVLWTYDWDFTKDFGEDFNRATQPAQVSDSDFLVGTSFGNGLRRVRVSRDGSGWKTEQVWESKAISPYYNDMVVHKGYLYGFNSIFFTCVNLETGKAVWKERGYGAGQVLLLADQDLLLILAEDGDVALVEAKPDARNELGRFHALTGKTWNHPVVAHGKLFVRNGEEAACFELAP